MKRVLTGLVLLLALSSTGCLSIAHVLIDHEDVPDKRRKGHKGTTDTLIKTEPLGGHELKAPVQGQLRLEALVEQTYLQDIVYVETVRTQCRFYSKDTHSAVPTIIACVTFPLAVLEGLVKSVPNPVLGKRHCESSEVSTELIEREERKEQGRTPLAGVPITIHAVEPAGRVALMEVRTRADGSCALAEASFKAKIEHRWPLRIEAEVPFDKAEAKAIRYPFVLDDPAALAAAYAAMDGVDFSADPGGAGAASLKAAIALEGEAASGLPAVLCLRVTNEGTADATRVYVCIDSDDPLFNRVVPVGRVKAGAETVVRDTVAIPARYPDKAVRVKARLAGPGVPDAAPHETVIPVKGIPWPAFEHAYTLLDDGSKGTKGNGDGKLQKDEAVLMRLQVRNTGKAAATNVKGKLQSTAGVELSRETFDLASLEAGTEQTVEILIKAGSAAGSVDIRLRLEESGFGANISTLIRIPIEPE